MHFTICHWCKHFKDRERGLYAPLSCTAFPQGIPEEILDGQVSHRYPFPGDKGIQFEKQEDETKLSEYMKGVLAVVAVDSDTLLQVMIDLMEEEVFDITRYKLKTDTK